MRPKSNFMGKVRPQPKIPEPTKTGLDCPICGCRSVQRDVNFVDRWFVEWCHGGVLRVHNGFTDFESSDLAPLVFYSSKTGDYIPEFIEFPCPYYDVGFER